VAGTPPSLLLTRPFSSANRLEYIKGKFETR
jgi:hypothetical protein